MADPAARPVKRCLGNVAMHVNCVRKGRDKLYSALRWKIQNFLTLKDTVRYKWKAETPDWILKLDKKRYSITVTIESENRYGATTGFVCYESLKFSEPVTFEQVCDGVYKAQFCPKIVNHKDNEILKKHGRLELCFPFEVKWNLATGSRPYYAKKLPVDEMILSCAITRSLFRCPFSTGIQLTDFGIFVEDNWLYLHKAILGLRSPYFNHFIDKFYEDGKKGCMCIKDWTPEVLGRVLWYIYEGISVIPKDVNLRIEIFKLAHVLRISSLKGVYQEMLLRDINETNVMRIKEAGISTGTLSLIETADAFLSEYGSSISDEAKIHG